MTLSNGKASLVYGIGVLFRTRVVLTVAKKPAHVMQKDDHAGCSEEKVARSHGRETVSDNPAFQALCQSDLEGRRCEWKPTASYKPTFDYLSRIWCTTGRYLNTAQDQGGSG